MIKENVFLKIVKTAMFVLFLTCLSEKLLVSAADTFPLPDHVRRMADGTYQMEIYDIDDGYMNVPYDPGLPHHAYEWEKLRTEKQTGFLNYEDKAYAGQKTGIDVSKFQGNIDWEKVKESGIDFVMIRMGYRGYSNGKLMLDEKFEQNIKGAADAGIKTGVYFFSQAVNAEEAEEEAEFVLKHIRDYEITYPVTFDTEKIKFDEFRADGLTPEALTEITKTFCSIVKEAGYRPMIYANSQWLTTKLNLEELTEYDIWYADYEYTDHGNTPRYPYRFAMWQYSNQGRIDGIEGLVDLNLFFE